MASIEVQESVLARLIALADHQGITLDAYLGQLAGLRPYDSGKLPRLTGEELERLLEAEASSDSTYEGTYPRADIYCDHG
jgi:hypothetical protein